MFFSFNTIFITYNAKSIFTGSRGRKGWNNELNKTVEILNIQNEVNDLTFTTKFIMKTVKEKIDVRDQNLHKSLTQEIRCLLTNDNQPISPRVEMFEVFFSNR
jgi:ABC-type antimicrobial peptide transport system permease subunit